MLKRLYVDNYRCLVNFELPLSELTLLLGPNGTGKTSVFDVVHGIRQLLDGVAKVTDPDAFPTSTLTRWQDRPLQVFELTMELAGEDEMSYRLEVEHERQTRRASIALERLTAGGRPLFESKLGDVQLYRDDHSEGPRYSADWAESALARVAPRGDNLRLSSFLDAMRKVMVCGLHPRSFQPESASEDPLLRHDGHNFAAWYRHILQERPDLIPDYTAALKEVIDGFQGIRLEKVGEETRALKVIFDDDAGRYELRLDELSDGQRALLALYALVKLTEGQGYTLLLDEPDNFVALPEIQPWLIELADVCGEALPQAVLCSHHPELIDYLGGDRGLLLKRERTGVVTARPLDTKGTECGLKLSEIVARNTGQDV